MAEVVMQPLAPPPHAYDRKASICSTSGSSSTTRRQVQRKAPPMWTGSLENLTLADERVRDELLRRMSTTSSAMSSEDASRSTSVYETPASTPAKIVMADPIALAQTGRQSSNPSSHKSSKRKPPPVITLPMPPNFSIPKRMDSLSPHHHVLEVDPPMKVMLGSVLEDRRPSAGTVSSSAGTTPEIANLFFEPSSPRTTVATSQSGGPGSGKSSSDGSNAGTFGNRAKPSYDWPMRASDLGPPPPMSRPSVNFSRPLGGVQRDQSDQSVATLRRHHAGATSWSVLDELERSEASRARLKSTRSRISRRRSPTKQADEWDVFPKAQKESRKERKERLRQEEETFAAGPRRIPDVQTLFEVSQMEVSAEDGTKVKFGDIVRGGGGRQTVVVFIRHWYCPLCAEYMESIIREVDVEALEAANVDLVVIGNGSSKMAKGYRSIFKCPFKVYTDPKLRVYRGLGMTRQTMDGGLEDAKGDYITKSALQGTLSVVKNAPKMPLRRPGAFAQLGGEFVFQSALSCSFANRMTNTRDHAPIRDVVAHAGVSLDFYHRERGETPPAIHRESPDAELEGMAWGAAASGAGEMTPAQRLAMEERRRTAGEHWKIEREVELERIREERMRRRDRLASLGINACGAAPGEETSGEDTGEEDVPVAPETPLAEHPKAVEYAMATEDSQ